MIAATDIDVYEGWILVKGIGKIGLYSPSTQCILLDYSMKWMVGTNVRIPCKHDEIVSKILHLFNTQITPNEKG